MVRLSIDMERTLLFLSSINAIGEERNRLCGCEVHDCLKVIGRLENCYHCFVLPTYVPTVDSLYVSINSLSLSSDVRNDSDYYQNNGCFVLMSYCVIALY